jgi:hypothetical protein
VQVSFVEMLEVVLQAVPLVVQPVCASQLPVQDGGVVVALYVCLPTAQTAAVQVASVVPVQVVQLPTVALVMVAHVLHVCVHASNVAPVTMPVARHVPAVQSAVVLPVHAVQLATPVEPANVIPLHAEHDCVAELYVW